MSGQGRRPAIDPEDVLEILQNAEEPFLSTGEITARIDASKPTVRDRLTTLQDRGEIRSREVGSNTPVWYLPELENRRLVEYTDEEVPPTPESPPDTDGGAAAGPSREVLLKYEDDFRELYRDVVEEIERERTREASEETADTWGERAKAEEKVGFRIAGKAGVGFVIWTAGYLLLQSTVPDLLGFGVTGAGSFGDWILMIDAVVFLIALWGVAYGAAFRVIARYGIADLVEKQYRSLKGSSFQQ